MSVQTNAEARRARAAELTASITAHRETYVTTLEELAASIETHLQRLHAARLAWNEDHHEAMRLAHLHEPAGGAANSDVDAMLADLAGGAANAETLRTSPQPYTRFARRWVLPPALYQTRPALTRGALAIEAAQQLAERVMHLPTEDPR